LLIDPRIIKRKLFKDIFKLLQNQYTQALKYINNNIEQVRPVQKTSHEYYLNTIRPYYLELIRELKKPCIPSTVEERMKATKNKRKKRELKKLKNIIKPIAVRHNTFIKVGDIYKYKTLKSILESKIEPDQKFLALTAYCKEKNHQYNKQITTLNKKPNIMYKLETIKYLYLNFFKQLPPKRKKIMSKLPN